MSKDDDETPLHGVYAFWPYSHFPYVSYGEATAMNPDGRVQVPSYQMSVRPLLLLPTASALELIDKLKELVRDERNDQARHHEMYLGLLQRLFPQVPVEWPPVAPVDKVKRAKQEGEPERAKHKRGV
jgi:hypothetical protein